VEEVQDETEELDLAVQQILAVVVAAAVVIKMVTMEALAAQEL
jgi:hypothetical protein